MRVYSNPITVSGNPATFTVQNAKVLSLSVPIVPTQDLHGYSSPWPAGGGRNKIVLTTSDIKAVSGKTWTNNTLVSNGITFTILEDAAGNVTGIRADGTASELAQIVVSKTDISQGIYYLSADYYSSSAFVRGVFRDSNNAAVSIGGSVFTDLTIVEAYREVPSNVSYLNIYININSGTTVNNVVFKPMLRVSTESSAYAPYSNICPITGRTGLSVYVSPTQDPDDATTYAVDWTSEAGTVYGGTLDVVTGVLTIDRIGVDGGSVEWTKVTGNSYRNFSFTPSPLPKYLASQGTVISSQYKSEANNTAGDSDDNYVWIRSNNIVCVKDTSKASLSASDFKTAMTGVQFVWELATPLTYQLTAQEVAVLVGENNVWTSSGPVSVTVEAPIGGTVTNPTPFEARPMLEVSGVGEITINGKSIQILESVSDFDIDCEAMEAEDNSKIYCMDFPELSGGENEIVGDVSITSLTVVPRWWTL